jgi:hypothetical protein
MEGQIGLLTAVVNGLRHEAKVNAKEYERNKSAVANMREKYAELQELRDLQKAARAEIEDLKAALEEERANPLPGFKVPLFDITRNSTKRGAPFNDFFENTIAPAMLNTGATPEQINELIRKPQFNTHHTIPYPPTPTHPYTLYTHTFRRAVRAAVLQTLRVADGPSLADVVAGEAGRWGRPG